MQALNIPVSLINQQSATVVGNAIRTFLKTEISSTSQKWRRFIRIQVDIDTLRPLIQTVPFPCQGRKDLIIEIRYERLSEFCYKCGLLGHKFQSCSANFGEIALDFSTISFGPWLKSQNQHIQNPVLKNQLQKTNLSPHPPQHKPLSLEKISETTMDIPGVSFSSLSPANKNCAGTIRDSHKNLPAVSHMAPYHMPENPKIQNGNLVHPKIPLIDKWDCSLTERKLIQSTLKPLFSHHIP